MKIYGTMINKWDLVCKVNKKVTNENSTHKQTKIHKFLTILKKKTLLIKKIRKTKCCSK